MAKETIKKIAKGFGKAAVDTLVGGVGAGVGEKLTAKKTATGGKSKAGLSYSPGAKMAKKTTPRVSKSIAKKTTPRSVGTKSTSPTTTRSITSNAKKKW